MPKKKTSIKKAIELSNQQNSDTIQSDSNVRESDLTSVDSGAPTVGQATAKESVDKAAAKKPYKFPKGNKTWDAGGALDVDDPGDGHERMWVNANIPGRIDELQRRGAIIEPNQMTRHRGDMGPNQVGDLVLMVAEEGYREKQVEFNRSRISDPKGRFEQKVAADAAQVSQETHLTKDELNKYQ